MAYLIGIDLGTSSVKAVLVDVNGVVITQAQEGYVIETPQAGYAEQSPAIWWKATINVVKEILNQAKIDPASIAGIGLSGQMHGLVMLNKEGKVVRPAIIWSDQRSKVQVEKINQVIQEEMALDKMMNVASTGFAVSSLLWVKENEPENYVQADKILLPKDYIRYQLTGEIGSDVTDASATLAFNVAERKWASFLLEKLELRVDLFPTVFQPYEIAGEITQVTEESTGLKQGTPVVFGAGDQFMQGIGNGITQPGIVSSNIGTGGQIAVMVDQPVYDSQIRTNTFCHVRPNTWNIQGSSLTSGLSLSWLKDKILKVNDFGTLTKMAGKVDAGSVGLLFLPYLTGERTPHMNPNAKGIFFGLTLGHQDAHMVRAVMEGVIFSLKDSLQIIESLGVQVDKVIASGGGAKSKLWRQMQADIFNKPIYTTRTVEEACIGAAITAGVGTGIYKSFKEACEQLISFHSEVIEPRNENHDVYLESYELFKALYKRNKELF